MATIPETQPGSKLGLRQIRAQQLREQDERRQRELSGSSSGQREGEAPAEPARDAQEYQGSGPVGTGDYVVQSGDCISSIAKDQGYSWETIWNHASNTELRETRQNPNVLLPQDRVHLPEKTKKYDPGQTELRHRFVRRGEPAGLIIRALEQGVPRADQPYEVRVDGQVVHRGRTDREGKLRVPISGRERSAVLSIGAGEDIEQFDVRLGTLAPSDCWSGVQTRLDNLGFPCQITGVGDEQTLEALNAFRASRNLPRSNRIDEPTRAQLKQAHGA